MLGEIYRNINESSNFYIINHKTKRNYFNRNRGSVENIVKHIDMAEMGKSDNKFVSSRQLPILSTEYSLEDPNDRSSNEAMAIRDESISPPRV